MAGNFKPFQSPEDKLKSMLLEHLDRADIADANGHKKEFCVHVKHFLLLLKADIPKTIQENIEKRHEGLEKEVDIILKDTSKSTQERETLSLKKEYEAYSQDLVDGIDCMRNSKIMKRRITGIMLSGKTLSDMNKLGKEIRDSNAVETVIEDDGEVDGELPL